MKNTWIFLCAAVLLSFKAEVVKAQWTAGEYMLQAWATTIGNAATLADESSYGFIDDICLTGAILNEDGSVRFRTSLEKSKQYVFIGGGDEDATDLDLRIKSASGTILEEDDETDNTPIVSFSPSYSGTYIIELELYSCSAVNSFACVAFMEKYGNSVPVNNIKSVGKKFFIAGGKLSEYYSGMKFHDLPNQWCLYTAILDQGGYSQISNLDLGSENHVFYAVGDQNAEDIDLSIYDGSEWHSDTQTDAFPVVELRSYSYNAYKYKITNYDSDGKSLMMAGIFTR